MGQRLNKARQLAEKMGAVSDDWNGFNVLQRAHRGSAALTCFVPKNKSRLIRRAAIAAAGHWETDVVYLLGARRKLIPERWAMLLQSIKATMVKRGPSRGCHSRHGLHRKECDIREHGRPSAGCSSGPVGEAKEDWDHSRTF